MRYPKWRSSTSCRTNLMSPLSTNPLKALRVAIVAENASFRFGGEASLPLHYFLRLRQQGIEAWLIIHGRTRPELEKLFPADQDRIQYIPDRWYHKLIWQLSRPLPRRVSRGHVRNAHGAS